MVPRHRSFSSVAWTALAIAPLAAAQVTVPGDETTPAGPRVTGRFVDTEGSPLAGVGLTAAWRGLSATDNDPWHPLAGLKSDAAGRFVVALETAASLELIVAPPGLARRAWSEQLPHAGADRDLGDLVLEPEAVLTVWIVDARGELLTHGWSIDSLVSAADDAQEPHPEQRMVRALTPIDAARGSARLAHLPRGTVHVIARGPHGVDSNTVSVQTVAGGSQHVHLRYVGPDPSSFVVLEVRAPERPLDDVLSVRAADGAQVPFSVDPHGPMKLQTGAWSTLVRGALVGEGPWTLESVDPRFKVAAQPALRPGARLTIELVGSAALALEVVDAETGRPIDTLAVELRKCSLSSQHDAPLRFPAREVVGHALTNLVPGDYWVSVAAAEFAESETLLELAPHTVHSERIELWRPVAYSGRVVDTKGASVAGTSVVVYRGHVPDWSIEYSRVVALPNGERSSERPPFASTRTGADGRFGISGLAPGPLTFIVDRRGMRSEFVHATHASSAEQVLSVPAPTRIEVTIDLPVVSPIPARGGVAALAGLPALGVALDAPENPDAFAELYPERIEVVPATSDGTGSLRAVLWTTAKLCRVTLVRGEGTDALRRWIPVDGQGVDVGPQCQVRFDGHALLPATVRLTATATASPAATSLRAAWLALGLQRADVGGEAWRRSGHVPLPPPPPSLVEQPLTVSVKVPAGDYVRFIGGPGWRHVSLERLSLALHQSIDVVVDADPPLVAREVRLEAGDGTPLATTGVQLWFEGVHPLPPGERLIPVTALTDEAGRFRAVGPVGAHLHASVARDAVGAVLHARPTSTLDAPRSDGSAVMAIGAEPLVLTVRAP